MRHEPFDFRAIDVRSLSPARRQALKQVLVRRAHAARAAAIRQAVARLLALLRLVSPARLASLIRKVRSAHMRRRDRLQGMARLRAMTDYELRDIGLSRSEIKAAAWRDGGDPKLRN